MKSIWLIALGTVAGLGLTCTDAQAWHHGGFAIGVNIGAPVFYRPWPCCYPDYYVYRPYPVYVAPAPVIVQPAPVVAAPAAQVASASTAPPPPPVARGAAPESTQALTSVSYGNPAEVERYVQLLADPNESVRLDAVMQLGKLKADRAIDPVAATLSGDRSPAVRDAAARALGLIGSPRGLTALKYAAQADGDRDVRHSAQFAVEIIQSGMKR